MTDFLQHYKTQKQLSTDSQIILMDRKGQLKASCNALFSTEGLLNASILQWSPFLESIFANLLQIDKPFEFNCVESNIEYLTGFFDYHFQPIEIEGKPYILWVITDKTSIYSRQQEQQQRHHNRILREE